MTDDERRKALQEIAAEVRVCTRCRLSQGRTQAVPGEGDPATEVMFVGEAPGYNEDRQGRPFVGQAGSLLEEMLDSVWWKRDEVFITNMVKCRPPDNRDPEPDELAACAPYLARQIAALDPALVVTLGRFSMARFNPGARIGQVHGTYRKADPGSGAPDAFTFALYHPAAALRQASLRQTMFVDVAGVPNALQEARATRASRPVMPDVRQPIERAPGPETLEASETIEAVGPEPPAVEPAPVEPSTAPPPLVELEPIEPDSPSDRAGEAEASPAQTDPTSQLALF